LRTTAARATAADGDSGSTTTQRRGWLPWPFNKAEEETEIIYVTDTAEADEIEQLSDGSTAAAAQAAPHQHIDDDSLAPDVGLALDAQQLQADGGSAVALTAAADVAPQVRC
jgi:hypothetical protein